MPQPIPQTQLHILSARFRFVSSIRHAAGAAERLLKRVEWTVLRRLDGLLQGDYRSLFYGNGIDFADLQKTKSYAGWPTYSQSKLANVLFSHELARRLAGTGVTSNCLHPGVVATGFGRSDRGIWGLVTRLAAPFLLSPEKGAATTIYLALSPEVETVSGKYFADCKVARPAPEALDLMVASRLWQVSENLTGLAKDS